MTSYLLKTDSPVVKNYEVFVNDAGYVWPLYHMVKAGELKFMLMRLAWHTYM